MPRYTKDDHVIFASSVAYKAIYEAQGYLPLKEGNDVEKRPAVDIDVELEDDYSEDDNEEAKDAEVSIDPNDAIPLAARVAMLSYDELKAKAKELGIPKYANTKRDELVNLIVEKLEVSND